MAEAKTAPRARGGSFRLGPEGRMICSYISSSVGCGSALSNLGMPKAGTTAEDALEFQVAVGKALDAVTKAEELLTGKRVKTNLLVRRFAAYLGAREAKNRIPYAEAHLNTVYQAGCQLRDVIEAEENLLVLRDARQRLQSEDARLRARHNYPRLLGVFKEHMDEFRAQQ